MTLGLVDQELLGRVLMAAGIVAFALVAGWCLRGCAIDGLLESSRLRGVQQGRELAEQEMAADYARLMEVVRRDLEAEEREFAERQH